MPINNNNFQQENKELKLEEKNKQNSDITKPLMYTGLSVAGVVAISIIGKILYDKSKKNDNNNPGSQQNKKKTKVELAENYNPYVTIKDKNYLMAFKQNDSYCFHNALLQLLACPEIRCKIYGLENIDKEIGWINSVIDENHDTMTRHNSLTTPIEVPENFRLQPEVKFANPLTGEKIDLSDAPMFDLKSRNEDRQGYRGNAVCFDVNAIALSLQARNMNHSFINIMIDYEKNYSARLLDLGFIKVCGSIWLQGRNDVIKLAEAYPEIVENKIENFVACIQGMGQCGDVAEPGLDAVSKCKEMVGYYPTFGTALISNHYYHFYLIYDGERNIKKILWNAGEGFDLMSEEDFNKKFNQGTIYVKFSNKNIVEKYYTE